MYAICNVCAESFTSQLYYQVDCFQCSGEFSLTKSQTLALNSAPLNKSNCMMKKHT